ncbi:TetR/AcrR family transcriptional regulator [Nocardia sp. NPDC056952]|uniref:TetR/AcrR family transcriptional regulator n=1 Tax=Nocardia sp. NPDC056952 TaxID=3345979 RepID=UPI00362D1431
MNAPMPDQRLPRGPHRMTRAEVAESQRGRLLLAMLDAIASHGYNSVTVADLVSRARVSRRTFYELFDSKEDCLAAAFETIFRIVEVRLTDAIKGAGQLNWRELIRTSLAAYLDILAEEPAVARALHVEALIAGPALAVYRAQLMSELANRMRAARELAVQQGELTGSLPDGDFDFLIGGIDDRIRDCLRTRGPSALPALGPPLSRVTLRLLGDSPVDGTAQVGQ